MSRYEIRISELTELGYKIEQAKELARAEEIERQTDALKKIADFLTGKTAADITFKMPGGVMDCARIKTGEISISDETTEKLAQVMQDRLRKNTPI